MLLAVGFLTISVAVIPDIISADVEEWAKGILGAHYKLYFVLFFIVGSLLLVFLNADFSGKRFINRKAGGLIISWSRENAKLVRQAREAIKNAEPEEALKCLDGLKSPGLNEEITLLSGRLAQFRRESRLHIRSLQEETVAFNRINRDINNLIEAVEKKLSEEEKKFIKVRDYLKERYQKRLSQKLAGRQPVNLRMLPSKEGTSEDASAIFVPFAPDEIGKKIHEIFLEAHGRLLIVGAPGAGKTTLLLQLELSLLDAEKDVLPVVLNLAAWNSRYGTLETWLENIFPSELGINTGFAKKIVRQFQLILLFDGLDEVSEKERKSCLDAIEVYGANAKNCYAIASRIEEYKSIARDAPVYGQIEVGPLSIEQIEAELERIGYAQPEALPLLQAIRKDELLREIVKTPFYFNTLQFLFARGIRLSDLNSPGDDVEAKKKAIISAFIKNELITREKDDFHPELAERWMSFFACQMKLQNIAVFELSSLQFSWNRSGSGRFYFFGVWIVEGLITIPAFSLILTLMAGAAAMLAYSVFLISGVSLEQNFLGIFLKITATGLLLSLIIGLFAGIGSAIKNLKKEFFPIIKTKDHLTWSNKRFLKNIKTHILSIFFISAKGGIIFSMAYGSLSILLDGFYQGVINLISIIIIIIGCGLFFGLIIGLAVSFFEFFEDNLISFEVLDKPYQRFKASIRALHFSILQHWLLRYQLHRKGLLPLRLVHFLNDMTARHILESDGGAWRFRHRIIQDHFAEKWEVERTL